MAYVSELVFVDPSVDDIETILSGLRPGVVARVLDPAMPVARQIALALEGVHDLDAIHIIAHGAPGRVSFSSGEWSHATLEAYAGDLAAIGRALGTGGALRLWCCDSAAGVQGAVFVEALARSTGADVAAATGRIGAAALGGNWELSAFAQCPSARPPITVAAMANYRAVFATATWTGGASGNWNSANWTGGSGAGGSPGAGDNVVINQGSFGTTSAVTVTVSPGLTFGTLTLGNAQSNSRHVVLTIDSGTALSFSGAISTSFSSSDPSSSIQMQGTATLAGASLNLSNTAGLTGAGTLNISGNITNAALTASGNTGNTTLDVTGTIASGSGVTLTISSGTASDLKLEGTVTAAAPSITSANQTLELGSSANVTLTSVQTVSGGKIQLDGGTLTDASGITLGSSTSNGFITGSGTIAAAISHRNWHRQH